MNGPSVKPNKVSEPLNLNDIEMVFGRPSSPRGTVKPAVLMVNENHNHTRLNSGNDETDSDTGPSSQPLLEINKNRPKPPLAGPEIDDLDVELSTDVKPFRGIDDGLLEPNNNKPDVHEGGEGDGGSKDEGPDIHSGEFPAIDDNGTEDGKWPLTDELDGYDINGISTRFGNERPLSPVPETVNSNTYQQKKNLAQGMMDLALLSANANQLRYVLESSATHPYYYPSLVFIAFSIVLQIAVGVGLIMNSYYDNSYHDTDNNKHICIANKINNMTVLGIFLITIINVFITSFSVGTQTVMVGQIGQIVQAGTG